MDAKHFDAWTRRRFGLAAGSAVAALVAFRHTDNVAGKRRCKKLNRECDPNGKRCCGKLECDFTIVEGRSDFYCCKPDGATCTLHASCCSTNCLGTCQSCRGRLCSTPESCCPAIPCIKGFCGGCSERGE